MGPVRILWVKANKLLPLHSGGDIRSYHIAKYLASRHRLCFFSYYDGPLDVEYENSLSEHFPGSFAISSGKIRSTPSQVLDYALRLGDSAPYAVSRFKSAAIQEKLDEWFRQQEFEVAVCDFLDAAVNFPALLSIPTVLFQHNVESEIWRRHADTESNPAKRRVYRVEFRKMLAYEKATVNRFPHVVAVSENDRRLMAAWVDASRITVIPTGVDLAQYRPRENSSGQLSHEEPKPLVVFIGAMDWEPNIDAVEFFCKEIWPLVKENFSQVRFRIVGRNPDRRVRHFASDSIEVTGRVPAVIDHLREAAVVVVPLRIGGGTRLKIYEAMAAGKAVVSTTVGAEGLDVQHEKDILLADDPKAFAQAITMLLGDAELRKRYERAAAELALKYDWPSVGARFESVLQHVAGGVRGSQPSNEAQLVRTGR